MNIRKIREKAARFTLIAAGIVRAGCGTRLIAAMLFSSLFILGARPAEAQMQDIHRITDASSDSHVEYHKFDIAKGKEVQLADLKGPGKVTYFYITDDNAGKWHPGLVLKVYWDDATEPSINVPLADFFGVFAGKTIDFQSRLISVNHMCYMSYLPMPFSRRARFLLANDGEEDYSRVIAYGIDYEKSEAFAREPSRLHSQWKRSNPTKDGMHTLFETKGRGHYIGNFLYTHSRYAGWWGEGDTIFHLDGKPITHAPGTTLLERMSVSENNRAVLAKRLSPICPVSS